jgi:hypothetical protein
MFEALRLSLTEDAPVRAQTRSEKTNSALHGAKCSYACFYAREVV